MRLRSVKNALEKIVSNGNVILNPAEYAGKWKDVFANNNPIYLEIGFGKGAFIMEFALRYPETNFIGIEKFSSVLIHPSNKLKTQDISNLRLVQADAVNISSFFLPDEISSIFLNFSDPWGKARYAKRRLTHLNFLKKYAVILKDNGALEFKTDNRKLFEFSILEVMKASFIAEEIILDLHKEDKCDNILTEYEAKFIDKGPIYYLRLINKKL